MLTPYRPAILAACIAVLCTLPSKAQNQNSTTQSNQDQQQAQSNQQASPQLNAAAADQSSTSQQNQSNQPGQQNQQSADQSSSIRNEGIAAGQQGSSQQSSNRGVTRDAQQSTSDQSVRSSDSSQQSQSRRNSASSEGSSREWPAPQRYESRGQSSSNADRDSLFQYNNRQGQGRRRASLGVNIISDDSGRGITVMRTQPNTAAERMGLRPRDRIVAFNGQPVDSVDDFIGSISSMNPGDQVELTVERDGSERTIRGTLEAYAESITRFEGPIAQGINRLRGVIGRGSDIADDRGSIQTSYEDQGSSRSGSGDTDARINRLEQQIERLNREIQEIREAHNSSQPGSGAPSGSSSDRGSSSSSTNSSSQPSSSNSSSISSGAGSNSTSPGTSGGNLPAPNSSQSR